MSPDVVWQNILCELLTKIIGKLKNNSFLYIYFMVAYIFRIWLNINKLLCLISDYDIFLIPDLKDELLPENIIHCLIWFMVKSL